MLLFSSKLLPLKSVLDFERCPRETKEAVQKTMLNKHRHIKRMASNFTHLLAKSGGSEPRPSKKPGNTALKQGLGISHISWQNLAEVSRDRAKDL